MQFIQLNKDFFLTVRDQSLLQVKTCNLKVHTILESSETYCYLLSLAGVLVYKQITRWQVLHETDCTTIIPMRVSADKYMHNQ